MECVVIKLIFGHSSSLILELTRPDEFEVLASRLKPLHTFLFVSLSGLMWDVDIIFLCFGGFDYYV